MSNSKNELDQLFEKMENVPSAHVLRKVHEIGIEIEDYETCDAIKEFCENNGIKI